MCHTPWSRSHIRTHRFSHEFYDDHLGPSNSENDDNETIKNRGDYVETTIKGPDYLTSRIYRQRFTILPGKKVKIAAFSKEILIVYFDVPFKNLQRLSFENRNNFHKC